MKATNLPHSESELDELFEKMQVLATEAEELQEEVSLKEERVISQIDDSSILVDVSLIDSLLDLEERMSIVVKERLNLMKESAKRINKSVLEA